MVGRGLGIGRDERKLKRAIGIQVREPLKADTRKKVWARAGNRCEKCGERDADVLDIHHKNHRNDNNRLSNLALLCVKCHRKTHKTEKIIKIKDDLGFSKGSRVVKRKPKTKRKKTTRKRTYSTSRYTRGLLK